MGVNPVTGGDGAVLIKEIKAGRRKARHDSPTSTPPLLFPPLRLGSLRQQQACGWRACPPLGKGSCWGCLPFRISGSAGGCSRQSPGTRHSPGCCGRSYRGFWGRRFFLGARCSLQAKEEEGGGPRGAKPEPHARLAWAVLQLPTEAGGGKVWPGAWWLGHAGGMRCLPKATALRLPRDSHCRQTCK